jgi:hypothetical protein
MSTNKPGDEPFIIENVRSIMETDKAIKCIVPVPASMEYPDGEATMWFPKSQILDASEVYEDKQEGTLVIKTWLAIAKGLIDQ